MAPMAAETPGVDYSQVRSPVPHTASVGPTNPARGSRVTFATGMAVVGASKKIVDELRARAAMIWDVDVEGVVWEDGRAMCGWPPARKDFFASTTAVACGHVSGLLSRPEPQAL